MGECSRCGVGRGGFESHLCMLALRFQLAVVTFPFCAFRDRCDCPLQVLIPEVIFGVRESCCDSHVQVVIEISLFFWGPGKNVLPFLSSFLVRGCILGSPDKKLVFL